MSRSWTTARASSGFILGVQRRTFRDQDPANIEAAELVGRLHDALADAGHRGHDLERFLVRVVFCMFADDTGEFDAAHDDYNSILLKALADRLAEAFAERMHERVRKEFWGYAADEDLNNEALIREEYQGIRPAPGYPACPDHSEKPLLFDLLGAPDNASIILTEGFAMLPAAAVSGFYFAHPRSRYFGVGKIGRDQVEDYAARKGVLLQQAERWLAPNLGYEPHGGSSPT